MPWYPIAISALIGLAIVGLWGVLIRRHAVPELDQGLPSIRFHIAAELLTATGLLVAAAWLVAADSAEARLLDAGALGAVVYSTINSPGYYADRGERPVVATFAALSIVALSAIAVLMFGDG
jgi:hypothetical protein